MCKPSSAQPSMGGLLFEIVADLSFDSLKRVCQNKDIATNKKAGDSHEILFSSSTPMD